MKICSFSATALKQTTANLFKVLYLLMDFYNGTEHCNIHVYLMLLLDLFLKQKVCLNIIKHEVVYVHNILTSSFGVYVFRVFSQLELFTACPLHQWKQENELSWL